MNQYVNTISNPMILTATAQSEFKVRLKALNPLWFLLPALILMSIWVYWPLLKTIYYSTVEWNLLPTAEPVSVGAENYVKLFMHPDFGNALSNTALYILGMLPFSVIIPLALAIITEKMSTTAKNIYRVLFFLPMVMPPVTTSIIWRWMFHPTNGIVNHFLLHTGAIDEGINFLGSEAMALFSIIIIAGWKMIGFSTLMFSSALTGIDKSYYEAADIDNVSKIRQTLTITMPLISPTVIFMIMLSVLFTAQWTFTYINVLTMGGPAGASTNVYYLMYTYGFKNFNAGMSAASAITFFVMFGIIALIINKVNKRLAFYDN